MKVVFITAFIISLVVADVYLHNPRGANNRCDEKNNNRNNDNRLMDSENNAAGGYGVCDKPMYYYEKTMLKIEFYAQHSCGNGDNVKGEVLNSESTICQEILQLGCDFSFGDPIFAFEEVDREVNPYKISSGASKGRPGADIIGEIAANPDDVYDTFGDTCTQRRVRWYEDCNGQYIDDNNCASLNLETQRGTFNGDDCECSERKFETYGYHESEYWYDLCIHRRRNTGLWVADQNPGEFANKDRQEPNSARYGFECTEERDYYPYWHPTPWIDLAILVSDTNKCKFYRDESQNVKDKCWCKPDPLPATDAAGRELMMEAAEHNNEIDCTAAGFAFVCEGAWNWAAPDCLLAPAQTDNRLGNSNVKGKRDLDNDDAFSHYDWIIPDFVPNDKEYAECVIRLRYNISTGDISDDLDALLNDQVVQNNPVNIIGSPYPAELLEEVDQNDPEGPISTPLADVMPIRMAINTQQFGRTFEDRSYVFQIRKRPSELRNKKIHNLNVRGKRGNIAQVRNCVEYDFIPKNLRANVNDYIHFQWCGTDYNNNGNAGEGRDGTDRSNICELYEGHYDNNHPNTMNKTSGVFDEEDLKQLCWLRQKEEHCYTVRQMIGSEKNNQNGEGSCHFLNGVRDPDAEHLPTPYFDHMAQVKARGTFHYMSSRNNNFTNRSQKGSIAVGTAGLTTGGKIGVAVGVVAGVGIIAAVAFFALNPASASCVKSNRV